MWGAAAGAGAGAAGGFSGQAAMMGLLSGLSNFGSKDKRQGFQWMPWLLQGNTGLLTGPPNVGGNTDDMLIAWLRRYLQQRQNPGGGAFPMITSREPNAYAPY